MFNDPHFTILLMVEFLVIPYCSFFVIFLKKNFFQCLNSFFVSLFFVGLGADMSHPVQLGRGPEKGLTLF